MRRHLIRHSKGQVTVEVAILFGVVVAALVALAIYLRRAVQGGIKGNADSFGGQFAHNEDWAVHTRSATREEGPLIRSSQFSKACQGLEVANPGCDPDTGEETDPDKTAYDELPCPDGTTTPINEKCP